MDCGRYDRTNYEKEAEEMEAQRLQKIRLEEEEMMTLRPITADKTGGKIVNEQDTSLPDGFLRKLGKQDEKKFKKVGILSPEEGAGMFADLGNNMFGSKEDRDLIDGITGRGSSSSSGVDKKGVADSFKGDDDDLLQSLRDQMGARNLADISNIPDILNPTGDKDKKEAAPITSKTKSTGAPAPTPSIFDSRADPRAEKMRERETATSPSSSPTPSSFASDFTRAPVAVRPVVADSFVTPTSPVPSSGPVYGPALTTSEAEKLTDSLDDMTDDEVAAVLGKLRAAVSDRIKEEVSDAMMASGISRQNSMPGQSADREVKKMPRAPSINPEIREAFKEDFAAIEDELDKIYSDPLMTWREMMANPGKFLSEDEIGSLSKGEDN